MAITQRDYKPGVFEAFSGVDLGDPTIGVSAYFVLDGYWKFDVADVVLRADSAAGPILAAGVDYALLEDEKYTELEANYTGKTLYAKYTIVNAAFTGRPIFVEGNNFGSMMSNEDTKQYIDDNSGGGVQDFIDLNPQDPRPGYNNGRFFYDQATGNMLLYSGNPNAAKVMNAGEIYRAKNETGSLIPAGTIVDIRDSDIPNTLLKMFVADALGVANSSDEGWVVAVLTQDTPNGSVGEVMSFGRILNVDTSGLTPGIPAYLGMNGGITNTRPDYPAQSILIGTALNSDLSGQFVVNIKNDNYDYEFDGCVLERHDTEIVTDGATVWMDVSNLQHPTRDVPIQIGGTEYRLNTTSGPGVGGAARVELIQGTADSATAQWVYVDIVGGVPTLKTTAGYPSGPYAGIARVAITTAAAVNAVGKDGIVSHRRQTTSKAHDSRGRISYVSERLFVESPKWWSGCTPTAVIDTAPTPDSMDLTSIGGVVYQTHRQLWPELSVAIDGVYVGNGPGGISLSNLTKFNNLWEVMGYTSDPTVARDTAARGNIVIWGAINKDTSECKLFCNLPNDLYGATGSQADSCYFDVDNTADYSVPQDLRLTAFLICRIPYLISGNSVFFSNPTGKPDIINLLGNPIGIAGGAAGGGSAFTPNLLQVLAEGNSAGGQQIKDLANATDGQDALPKAQADTLYTVAGHTHTGAGGPDGGVIDHDDLNNIGSVPHANLDLHFNDANFFHDHVNLQNAGTNTHAQIDAALATLGDYLKRDGSLPMTGDLDMDGNDIKDIGAHVVDFDRDMVGNNTEYITNEQDTEITMPIHREVFGEEYLWGLHKRVFDNDNNVKVKFLYSGDSTTAGDNAGLWPPNILGNYECLRLGLGIHEHVNVAVSGQSAVTWNNTLVDADITNHPDMDVYIARWGINDGSEHGSVATFINAMDSGLSKLRAHKEVDELTIFVMAPSATYDVPNNRSTSWFESIIPELRKICRKYRAVFFDTYFTWQDAKQGALAGDPRWLDDPFGDGRGIHPDATFNHQIVRRMFEIMLAPIMRVGLTKNNFINTDQDQFSPPVGVLPSGYSEGLTIYNVNTSDGWFMDGKIVVIRNGERVVINYYQTERSSTDQTNLGLDNLTQVGETVTDTWGPLLRVRSLNAQAQLIMPDSPAGIAIGHDSTEGTRFVNKMTNGEYMFHDQNQVSFNRNPVTGLRKNASVGSSVVVVSATASGGTVEFWTTEGANDSLTKKVLLNENGTLTNQESSIADIKADQENYITLAAANSEYVSLTSDVFWPYVEDTNVAIDSYSTRGVTKATVTSGTLPTAETEGWITNYNSNGIRQEWRPKNSVEIWARYFTTVWSTWTALSLPSSWVTASTEVGTGWTQNATYPVRYRKVGDSVEIFGTLDANAPTAVNTTFLTLPLGYRPPGTQAIEMQVTYKDTSNKFVTHSVTGFGATGGVVFRDNTDVFPNGVTDLSEVWFSCRYPTT